jgi:hypothetical protein
VIGLPAPENQRFDDLLDVAPYSYRSILCASRCGGQLDNLTRDTMRGEGVLHSLCAGT